MSTKKGKTRTITITVEERHYQMILKACRVYGCMSETLLMEVGTEDAEKGAEFMMDKYHSHPLVGVCNTYNMFMQMAVLPGARDAGADAILAVISELTRRI